jgi:uncharacterized protein (DUF58 family)
MIGVPVRKLLFATVAAFIGSYFLGLPLLAFAAAAVAAIALLSRYMTQGWIDQAFIKRSECPLELEIGGTFDVEVAVENRGRWPIVWLLVEDLIDRSHLIMQPPALHIQGHRLKVLLLWGNSSQTIRYRIQCNRRGYFQIGPTIVETGDLLGLERQFRIAVEPAYVMVKPQRIGIDGYNIASPRPIGEIRISHSLIDDPTRIAGVRQYQLGDPLRRVHWGATARTGKLHSKVFEPTTVAGATIVLDLHIQSNPDAHEPMRSELAITAAASLSQTLYEQGQPVGLVSNGRDIAERIRTEGYRLDYGSRDAAHAAGQMVQRSERLRPVVLPASRTPQSLEELHRMLARLERTDGLQLANLLMEAQSRLARDTTIVIILQSPSEADLMAIGSLARRGWMVTVIVNTHHPDDYARSAGAILATGAWSIQLTSQEQLSHICRSLLNGAHAPIG